MKTFQTPLGQRGVTLIELMVGLSIGLMVVAVAMGTLMVSRGISGSVSDASGIQQQGAYILRVIGQQLRQAGSLYLNPDPVGGASTDVLSAVAFEIKADPITVDDKTGNGFEQKDTLAGTSNTLTTGFRRYQDNVFLADNATSSAIGTDFLSRNCVGSPGNSSTDQRVESIFAFDSEKNELQCSGNGTTAQAITQNVAQFQVTYLEQASAAGGTTVKYLSSAADVSDWRRVQGVQVCLVLYGSESIAMPAGSSYTDCEGTSVDMTTLTGTRKNRMHLLFRNTFQLRSQGLL